MIKILGDLIFIRGKGLIPRGIELFDGRYSHVAIVLSPTRCLQSQGMMRSGIVPFDFEDYDIVNLRLTDKQKSLVYPVAIQLCNFGYDYGEILGIALERMLHIAHLRDDFDSPTRYTCSELVDVFLWSIGWVEDDEYVGNHTPNELYRFVWKKLNSK